MTDERKYPFVRVRAGDYLLIGNDGESLYRVTSYEENGSLVEYPPGDRTYAQGKPVVGTFWNVWRFTLPVEKAEEMLKTDASAERLLDWDLWREVSTLNKTRREAVASI